jgi:hypothetical protein
MRRSPEHDNWTSCVEWPCGQGGLFHFASSVGQRDTLYVHVVCCTGPCMYSIIQLQGCGSSSKYCTYKRHCLVAFGWLWPSFFLNGQRRLDVSPIVQSIDARSTATDRVPPGRLIDLRKVLHGKIFVPGKLRMRSTSLAKLNNQAPPRTYFVTRLTLPEASERSWGGPGAALRRDYTRMDVIQSRRSSWNGKNNNVTFR